MNERRQNLETKPEFSNYKLTNSTIHADRAEGRWTTVLEAVQSYIENGGKTGLSPLNGEQFSKHSLRGKRQTAILNRLQDALVKLENISTDDPNGNFDDCYDLKSAITDSNRELESILHMVKSNVPDLLNKVLLCLDEQVSQNNSLQLELEEAKSNWKKEVASLKEELTEQTTAVAHLTSLQSAKQGRDQQEVILRRMRQSESEVSRLKEILSGMNSLNNTS